MDLSEVTSHQYAEMFSNSSEIYHRYRAIITQKMVICFPEKHLLNIRILLLNCHLR